MLRVKSYIFVVIAIKKSGILFYLLTKTIAIEAGDQKSPAFFLL
jgi:hypothetical protein